MRKYFFVVMSLFILAFPLTAEAASKKDKGGETGPQYVQLDPLLLPIIDEDGVQQVVSMVVAIEVKNASKVDKVNSLKPKLTDAYIQNMYGILNRHAALKGGVIQVKMIKDKLNKITKDVVGKNVAKDVLLQVVQQRPI